MSGFIRAIFLDIKMSLLDLPRLVDISASIITIADTGKSSTTQAIVFLRI